MPYSLYLRKSRADHDYSDQTTEEIMERHKMLLLELARKNNLCIAECYQEVASGETIQARPVMQRLLRDVSLNRWDGVLVVELERLARGNTYDQGVVLRTFQTSNTTIVTPLKTYDLNREADEDSAAFGLYMARWEYKSINRRLQQGRSASAKEGKFLGNRPPYGYQRVKLKKEKGYTLAPIPNQAKTVRDIFHWYVYGEDAIGGTPMGASSICHRLNDLGIQTQSGKGWHEDRILTMLRNPVYIGKIRWQKKKTVKSVRNGQIILKTVNNEEHGILADGRHPAIVEEEVFHLVQEKLSRHPIEKKEKTVQNPLAGLMVCGSCGQKMLRRPYHERNIRDCLYCKTKGCETQSSVLELVEERVAKTLPLWFGEYAMEVPSIQEDPVFLAEQLRSEYAICEKQLKKLSAQIQNLYARLELGFADQEALMQEVVQKKESQTKLTSEIDALQARLLQTENTPEAEREPAVYKISEIYEKLPTLERKNALLREMMEKIEYRKQKHPNRRNPEGFVLTMYPKLPKTAQGKKTINN